MRSLKPISVRVYEVIVRRFLAIFFEPAVYQKVNLVTGMENERFFASFKVLAEPGYRKVMEYSFRRKKAAETGSRAVSGDQAGIGQGADAEETAASQILRRGSGCASSGTGDEAEKGDEPAGEGLQHQRRGNFSAEALQFRIHDPGNGECGAAD